MIKAQTSAVIRTSGEIRGFRSLKHQAGSRRRALDCAQMIRTSAEIRGFRSLHHPVGPRLQALDWGRIMQGRAHRMARADHHAWCVAQGH